jgi:prepilin-type processing-associated H-X9-DG protein
MYAGDYDDVLPNGIKIGDVLGEHPQKLPSLLDPYTRSRAIFRCPSDTGGPAVPSGQRYFEALASSYQNYGWIDTTLPGASIYSLPWPVPLAALGDPTATSLARDGTSWHRRETPWNINVLYADGHVKFFIGNDRNGRAGIF